MIIGHCTTFSTCNKMKENRTHGGKIGGLSSNVVECRGWNDRGVELRWGRGDFQCEEAKDDRGNLAEHRAVVLRTMS